MTITYISSSMSLSLGSFQALSFLCQAKEGTVLCPAWCSPARTTLLTPCGQHIFLRLQQQNHLQTITHLLSGSFGCHRELLQLHISAAGRQKNLEEISIEIKREKKAKSWGGGRKQGRWAHQNVPSLGKGWPSSFIFLPSQSWLSLGRRGPVSFASI